MSTTAVATAFAVGAAGAMSVCHMRLVCRSAHAKRVIVAVSGTIQDGFELRKNIDYRAPGEQTVEAILLGYGVVRGAKMFFDIKDDGCREFDRKVPHRVNPAMVLTGDPRDANQYALYLVDERACLNALLGEPRLLTMTPDAVRIDLADPCTSPEVAAFARTVMRQEGMPETDSIAVLAVVACYQSSNFVAAPAAEVRRDGTRLTSFQTSLARFAGLDVRGKRCAPGSKEWNAAVSKALDSVRQQCKAQQHTAKLPVESHGADDRLYGTTSKITRLSRRLAASEFNSIASEAGLSIRAE